MTYTHACRELGSGNGSIDCLASCIVHQRKGGTGVGNGRSTRNWVYLAVDRVVGGRELPETVLVVDWCIPDAGIGRRNSRLVDVPECVEGLSLVWVIHIFVAAEIGGEQLG